MKRNSSSSPHKSMAAVDHNAPKSLFMDALYCEEGEDETANFEEQDSLNKNKFIKRALLLECDFCCWERDDEQLQSLLSKERETSLRSTRFSSSSCVQDARKQAVEFILRNSSHHGFSASAAIFAVNFLDRFVFDYLSLSFDRKEKPWLMQLVAVACLSLAAKVEETHVPLLVDLQVEEDGKYLFEAKTIERMELLILSALKWRMNPVTPLSFIDHIVRRLGLKSYVIQLDFLKSCENIILSLISDSRFISYYPSVMASAAVLHVVHQVGKCNAAECEKTMFDVLKITKEEVEECHGFMLDVVSNSNNKNGSKGQKWELSWSDHVIIDNDAVMNSDDSSSSSSHSPRLKKHKA